MSNLNNINKKKTVPLNASGFEQDVNPLGNILPTGGMHVGIGHPIFEKDYKIGCSNKIRIDKIGVVEKDDIDISGKLKTSYKKNITNFGDAEKPPGFTDELELE